MEFWNIQQLPNVYVALWPSICDGKIYMWGSYVVLLLALSVASEIVVLSVSDKHI